MFERFKNWLKTRFSDEDSTLTQDLRMTGSHSAAPRVRPQQKVPRPNPEYVATDDDLAGVVESHGPGKNVLIRKKFVREDTGTHETLRIIDDSIVDTGEETGIDPYNTGEFDRSKNWDRRFGK
jgi:hypothetical protein